LKDASRLDDRAFLSAHDPQGMLEAVEGSIQQWRDGFRHAHGAQLAPCNPRAICVCGMGGSGIAGDVLAAVAATRSRIPVAVVKGFDLPTWVDDSTLVIGVSYSGHTEETIACVESALRRGADLVAVARGGKLAELAADTAISFVEIEAGGLMPRAALPSLASAVLCVAQHAGALDDLETLEEEMLDALDTAIERWGPDRNFVDNEAKDLASSIVGTAPWIWGQEGALGVVAMRFKCQLNENAKMPASWAVVPEALHNEIVPMEDAGTTVILRSHTERAGISRRLDALDATSAIEVRIPGEGDLALIAAGALLADLTSIYCAALRGVDPSPIQPIVRLKEALG
jgi:glucose/mannose-6-phosphate isomerase